MSPRLSPVTSAVAYVAATIAALALLCAPFAVTRSEPPTALVLVARWLPALVSVPFIRAARHRLLDAWHLRVGWRRVAVALLWGALVVAAVHLLTAVLAQVLGLAELKPASFLLTALAYLPLTLVLALSTLGEEVGWRGWLRTLLRDRGFWPLALWSSLAWALFHVPLHATQALAGSLSVTEAVVLTAGIVPLGLLLAALVERVGSVWPAAFGHAVPFTALNLLEDPSATSARLIGVSALGWVLMVVAAALLVRRRAAR